MKIVRDYLTSTEIGYILSTMFEKESAIEREVVKVALVAQLVCEEIGDFEDCNDIYDKVVADSKLNFSTVINNYDIIDKLYAEETNINNTLKEFIIDINKKLDESVENFDLNSAIKQLKDFSETENKSTTVRSGSKNGKNTK